MSTVPVLNYAKIRHSSKSKNSQNSSRKEQEEGQNLFSHMNKDNLSYIQTQIRQKNKRNQHQRAKSTYEEDFKKINGMSHRQPIHEEKVEIQSRIKQNQQKQQDSQQEERNQDSKLSYYQMASNTKSRRFSSLQADFLSSQMKKSNKFMDFLENYISELNKSPNKGNFKKSNTNEINSSLKENQNKDLTNQKMIIQAQLFQQKSANIQLAKELQKYKDKQQTNAKKINILEKQVASLIQDIVKVKSMLETSSKKQKRQFASNRQTLANLQSEHVFRNYQHYLPKRNRQIKLQYRSKQVSQSSSVEKIQEQYEQFLRTGIPNLKPPSRYFNFRN